MYNDSVLNEQLFSLSFFGGLHYGEENDSCAFLVGLFFFPFPLPFLHLLGGGRGERKCFGHRNGLLQMPLVKV